jgi:hypothetical protein
LAFDIYKELCDRLAAIERCLNEPEPPTYRDFTDAWPDIENTVTSYLNANEDVSIHILAVTSQFSWRYIVEDHIEEFLRLGNRKQKISVELAIVNPKLLNEWQQSKLKVDVRRTLEGIEVFMDRHADTLKQGRLAISIYQFDNIPHWHGILINNDTLFQGTARWIIQGDSFELTVGQNSYRKFRRNDRFRGTDMIILFENWLESYKLRYKYNGDIKTPNAFVEEVV